MSPDRVKLNGSWVPANSSSDILGLNGDSKEGPQTVGNIQRFVSSSYNDKTHLIRDIPTISTTIDASVYSETGGVSETHTLNLFADSTACFLILNFPLSCSETHLFDECSRFGTISKISLVHPRSSEEDVLGSVPVYLEFARPASALAAKRYFDSNLFQGVQLRTCWAKQTDPTIFVSVPVNHELIEAVADYMVELGDNRAIEFESKLRAHPKFTFLNDRCSSEYRYLKWRIVSSLCPDFTTRAFRISAGGALWIPPPLSPDKRTQFGVGAQPLSRTDVHALTLIIKTINSTRNSVKSAMLFCIDRSHSSAAIVRLILSTEPLIADGQIGRLYLLSDLLFNAACDKKSAWSFRSYIENCLPQYFSRMHSLSVDSDRLRERFARTLSVWEKWNMFGREYLDGLRLVWGDLRLKYPNVVIPITIVEYPDLVETEMRNYGLMAVGDGNDAPRFQAYLRDTYQINADVDGESLTASDLEGIDGTPVEGIDTTGWFSEETSEARRTDRKRKIASFKLSSEPTFGPLPVAQPIKPPVSHKVHLADISRMFIDDSRRDGVDDDEDTVVKRKYKGYSYTRR